MTRLAELAGAPPRLASAADLQAGGPAPGTYPSRASGANKFRNPGLNLRAVADACIAEGLDPATEIVRALARVMPRVVDGHVVLGADGRPEMVPVLDPETRLRTLTELLQYVQPKLKAVEVVLKDELPPEQLDRRLSLLLAKAAQGASSA
jgi:hypothetical protein